MLFRSLCPWSPEDGYRNRVLSTERSRLCLRSPEWSQNQRFRSRVRWRSPLTPDRDHSWAGRGRQHILGQNSANFDSSQLQGQPASILQGCAPKSSARFLQMQAGCTSECTSLGQRVPRRYDSFVLFLGSNRFRYELSELPHIFFSGIERAHPAHH